MSIETGLIGALIASARVRAAALGRRQLAEMEKTAAAYQPRDAEFRSNLVANRRPNVIAECKRRSPLKGVLRHEYDVTSIAAGYERVGAAAVSVLTEPAFFDGALDHLHAVRATVSLPVLRKDFIVDERQMVESRAAGADAVLLIAAALSPDEMCTLVSSARALGLAVLVEVHDEPELETALASGAEIVGVNCRDLRTMTLFPETQERLASRIPGNVVRVAESGIRSRADIERLKSAGYQAFLVGERLMTSRDPAHALTRLLDAPRERREEAR